MKSYCRKHLTEKAFVINLLLTLVLAVSACEFNIDTLKVKWCTPAAGATGIAGTATIEIEFSGEVNKNDVEELFVLEYGTEKITGQYTWASNSRFTFTPLDDLEKNGRYSITVPREIRDSDGNTMGSDFLSDFYIGEDFVNPVVVASVPQFTLGATTDVAINQNISIDFSKSMNRERTQAAFSLSPDVSGYFVWSEAVPGMADSRLEYRLTKPMQYGKIYKLKLTEDAEDSAGNKTGLEYTVNFITGNDTTPPEVSSIEYFDGDTSLYNAIQPGIVSTRVSKNGPIMVTFSEPMDRQSVEKAITITPSVSGSFEWLSDIAVRFNPLDSFEPETMYQVAVETSCKDQNGLMLAERYAVEFLTNADDSLFIKTGEVSGSNDNINYSVFGSNWPVGIEMGDEANHRYYIRIRFMSSIAENIPAEMQKYSIYDKVIVDTYNNVDDSTTDLPDSAYISDISWDAADDNTVVIQLGGMTNYASGQLPALYRLIITGGKTGIKDVNGNYMQDDFIIEFREVQ